MELDISWTNTKTCTLWMGATDKDGYGWVTHRGNMEYIHRLTWRLANGPIPAGICVCHKCDTPGCYELDHLFLGTSLENQKDCTAKGRSRRGSVNGKAKLNVHDVRIIRTLAADGIPQLDLARLYGVQPPAINKIVHRRTWIHI